MALLVHISFLLAPNAIVRIDVFVTAHEPGNGFANDKHPIHLVVALELIVAVTTSFSFHFGDLQFVVPNARGSLAQFGFAAMLFQEFLTVGLGLVIPVQATAIAKDRFAQGGSTRFPHVNEENVAWLFGRLFHLIAAILVGCLHLQSGPSEDVRHSDDLVGWLSGCIAFSGQVIASK